MPSQLPRQILEVEYDHAAREYLRRLPLEHFMESIAQSTQRQITVESLELVRARRPDLHVFSELLVQYPLPRRRKLGQIVPDNMVVIATQPIRATNSYNLPLEPARPFWVMEYVSKGSKRKDYEKSFQKYEHELHVPYYLVFYPDNQDVTLFHLREDKYASVKPSELGRYAIPELDLELALLDGWIRFWYQGQLLPLPTQLQAALDEATLRAQQEKQRADEEARRADRLQARVQADQETIRALQEELARLRARRE